MSKTYLGGKGMLETVGKFLWCYAQSYVYNYYVNDKVEDESKVLQQTTLKNMNSLLCSSITTTSREA